MGFWFWFFVVGAGYFLYSRSKRKRGRKQDAPAASKTVERSIEERYGRVACTGRDCSCNDDCSDAERLFCREVMLKVLPKGKFAAQYPVDLPGKTRKLDFAFIAGDGRKIAIELDGFQYHAKDLGPDEFDDQLARQNELVLREWSILRFSFNQCARKPEYCAAAIRRLAGDSLSGAVVPRNAFKDVFIPESEFRGSGKILKPLGVLWTDKRGNVGRWYVPAERNIEALIPPGWEVRTWAPCVRCGSGEAHERHGRNGYFFKCPDCDSTFNYSNLPGVSPKGT